MNLKKIQSEQISDYPFWLTSIWVLVLIFILAPILSGHVLTAGDYLDFIKETPTKSVLQYFQSAVSSSEITENYDVGHLPPLFWFELILLGSGLFCLIGGILFLSAFEPTFGRRWVAFVIAMSLVLFWAIPEGAHVLTLSILAGYPILVPIFNVIPYDDPDIW